MMTVTKDGIGQSVIEMIVVVVGQLVVGDIMGDCCSWVNVG